MGHERKAPKGEISISNCKNRIRLRWRYAGKRYSLNLPYCYNVENLHRAKLTAAEITLDIAKDCFDPTLGKYNPGGPKPSIGTTKAIPVKKADNIPVFLSELVPHFNGWGSNARNIDIDNTTYYVAARRFLEKCRKIPLEQLPQKLNEENWSVSTYNERLSLLKNFLSWLLDAEIISKNPLARVNRKKNKRKKKNPRRIPLEEQEILTFLDAIKQDTYCPPVSRFKHSFYYPFLSFIFYTGVRNAEAIGLRVKHVNLSLGHIEISEALARTVKGTNHAARIRKGTKTENIRYLPLTDELRTLLIPLVNDKEQDDLVFTSPKGVCIDDKMLQRRILKPVLKKLGLGDRDLYSARHAFGTRAVQQGMALTDLAYLMGHSTVDTAVRNYVSVSRPAVKLPTITDDITAT